MTEDKRIGIIPSIFKELDKENIRYAVLRNYENLPESPLAGSDIDLLIDKENEEKYLLFLKSAVKKSGGFILLKIKQSNCLSCFLYQKEPCPLGVWLDAFNQISTKGFIWADGNFLLKRRILHPKGFYIIPPGGESATLFLKEIFSHSFIKKRYRTRIPNLIQNDKENFVKTLKPFFKEKIIQEMIQICLDEEWKKAVKKRKCWWRYLVFNNFFQRPIGQFKQFFNFVFSQLKKFLFKKGMIIAFMGPDGVGKTTICQGLENRMKNFFFKRIYQYHSHFGFFPELGEIYRWFFRKGFSESRISQGEKMGFFRSLLHLFYYSLENFLAWPWVFWLKIRGDLIIFDRYFYDFVIAKTNYRFLFWPISKIVPRPDLLFFIKARPEKIYERKKELSLEEIKRQLNVFQNKKISKLVPVVFINSEEELNLILNKVEDEILKSLGGKYGKK